MGMKEIMTEISATPPIRGLVVAAGRTSLGRKALTKLAPYRAVYPSLEEAWRAAGKRRHAGHEHPQAVDRHVELSTKLLPSDYAVLYWLNRIPGILRVFDFGGNMGNVFYTSEPYFDGARVSWTVYDLPAVIETARKLADGRTGPKPKFATTVEEAKDSNLLLVSGAYHYWEKSTVEFIDHFPRRFEHVIINRSPFYEKDREPVVAMQSTTKFAFPIVIRSEREFLDGFSKRGYKLVDRWTAAEYGHVMPFFPEQSVSRYSGFYFRLNETP
jgi:putative methyltransferase (TIGR04325 family)